MKKILLHNADRQWYYAPVELSDNPLLQVSFAGMATKKGRREGAACILSFDSSAFAFCGRGALTPFPDPSTDHHCLALRSREVLPGGSLSSVCLAVSCEREDRNASPPLQQ